MVKNKKDFPNCPDGDVLIVLNPIMTYKLHSQILSRASTFFAEQLEKDPAPLTAKARRDGASAYRFELTRSMTDEDSFGHLEWRALSETGSGKPSFTNFAHNGLNQLVANQERLRHWDLLFGAFYGIQIQFNQDNMAVLLSDCAGLLDVAESIGSIDRIREIVDLSLMRQDSVLWESIAANPVAWIGLGGRLQSPSIFTEAAVHLVGNWRNVDATARANLPNDIRIVIEEKYADLELAKDAIEVRILGHYPRQLIRRAADKPGRPSYANDIYMWMAVCFFRHYFAQAIADGRTRCAPDGGHAFYHVLCAAGQAYLHHEDFFAFHQYFPMSSKACNVLETNMAALKMEIIPFVDQLIINRTHVPQEKLNYLTCAVITKRDLPWEAARSTAPASQLTTLDQQVDDDISSDSYDDDTKSRPQDKGRPIEHDAPINLGDSDSDFDSSVQVKSPMRRPRVTPDASAVKSKDEDEDKGKAQARAKNLAPIKVPPRPAPVASTTPPGKPPGKPSAKRQRKQPRARTVARPPPPPLAAMSAIATATLTTTSTTTTATTTSIPPSAAAKKQIVRAKTVAPVARKKTRSAKKKANTAAASQPAATAAAHADEGAASSRPLSGR